MDRKDKVKILTGIATGMKSIKDLRKPNLDKLSTPELKELLRIQIKRHRDKLELTQEEIKWYKETEEKIME